jgi:hypothetical protein
MARKIKVEKKDMVLVITEESIVDVYPPEGYVPGTEPAANMILGLATMQYLEDHPEAVFEHFYESIRKHNEERQQQADASDEDRSETEPAGEETPS